MNDMPITIFKICDKYTEEQCIEKIKSKLSELKLSINKLYTKEYKFGIDSVKFNFFFASREKENGQLNWYENFKNLFELPNFSKIGCSSYGILLINFQINKINETSGKIENDRNSKYAITFGYGNNAINDIIDYNFGLEMASKIAKQDSINTQSSKFFSLTKNKSLVIYNSSNFTTQFGEAVDYLTAEIEEEENRTAVKQLLELIEKNVSFSTYVKTSMKKQLSFENLCKIIKNLDKIYYEYKGEKFTIPRLKYLGSKDKELIDKLNQKLSEELLKDKENINISIGMYVNNNGTIRMLENETSYILSFNRMKKEYSELTLKNIKDFMEEFSIAEIKSIKVTTENLTRDELYKYIDYTVNFDNSNEFFCLSNGKWTKFNREYIKKINREIEDKINKIIEFNNDFSFDENDLNNWRNIYSEEIAEKKYDYSDSMFRLDFETAKLYNERVYNYYLRDKLNAKLMDRKISESIEVSDIYNEKYKELIHVKIGGPGKFIECIDQSEKGMQYYSYSDKNKMYKNLKTKIGEIETITLLLIIENNTVWKKENINLFQSLRFKINLIEWYNSVLEMKYKPKIIIGKRI